MTDFVRYLLSKRTIDDRALNHEVWHALAAFLEGRKHCRILELGAGIGTMVERLSTAGLLPAGSYCLLDSDESLLQVAEERLGTAHNGCAFVYQKAEFQEFVWQAPPAGFDLVIAHSFLDLIHVPVLLPELLKLLAPDGAFYFTLNFDGSTIMQPTIDTLLDEKIERLYHQTMDERCVAGQPSGDSRTGRHLLQHLREAGAVVTAAGSSDWVVFAGQDGYPGDEAFFLCYILEIMEGALANQPELNEDEFATWINKRRQQVVSNDLYYIAHQLDYFGFLKNGHELPR